MKAEHKTVLEVTETEAKAIEFILEDIADRKTSSNGILIVYKEE